MIYLDNAATTKVDPEVSDLLSRLFRDQYGNASSSHRLGVQSKELLALARAQVAEAIHCSPEHIIFTSGATESNNTILFNLAFPLPHLSHRRRVLISPIEHPSILEAARAYRDKGLLEPELLRVNRAGAVDVEDLRQRMDEDVAAVLVMAVNNETGAIQPLREISAISREYGAHFHCDCVQALGKVEISPQLLDSASFSAHKVYGPKGIGALYVRNPANLEPFISGGGQQFNFRSGTEPVELAAGFGLACKRLLDHQDRYNRHISGLREYALSRLDHMPEATLNASEGTVPHILNLSIGGLRSDALSLIFERSGIAVSQGSACSSNHGEKKLSHVLLAMGLPEERIRSSVRLSFGKDNTIEEVEQVLRLTKEALEKYKVKW